MTTPCVATRLSGPMLLLAVVAGPAAAQPALPPPAAPVTLACAPRLAPAVATETGSVIGAPDVALRQLFGPGDALLLNVGQADGVSVGSQFFTRRVEAPSDTAVRNRGISTLHTSGWLRAVEVDEHAALAVVEQICRRSEQATSWRPFSGRRPSPRPRRAPSATMTRRPCSSAKVVGRCRVPASLS